MYADACSRGFLVEFAGGNGFFRVGLNRAIDQEGEITLTTVDRSVVFSVSRIWKEFTWKRSGIERDPLWERVGVCYLRKVKEERDVGVEVVRDDRCTHSLFA